MCQSEITPGFDQSIVFPDIDAATLAREDASVLAREIARHRPTTMSPWQDYLRKVLPPEPPAPRHSTLRLIQF